ncbi:MULTISPECIES: flagellar hook assembly protein FlgD [Thauera]|uniref:Basal-body rod modification protein FlgD n=1 Tax=Thauera linaloolentis (strain DSM 12138 / JCM 21573 / CCUG 41526 / CIP 105981 / IAM 15112 / NBRC 102519 / 47Lol) TaxID=1123367 RepID=N6Z525_THAL4|nr:MULTISPECIES: flagellar hook assembly protein FlgD [Thauera]ENO89523.1 flagellar hook capping protein [Thauera linaloolentis 47Lol = DSM 12138]MCM8565418.1 flagellar hook assembly protein FlgD [Thauera linaloolentis]
MTTVSNNTTAENVLSKLARSEPVQAAEEDMQGRFLKLLTTQLQNQDPMNPMENAELTSQLAQMSTVDGIERLNKMVQSFFDSQASSEGLNAAALIGRGVLVEGQRVVLTEAGGIGGFEIDGPADTTTLTIRDSSGLVVKQMVFDGLEAGSHNFVWDGTAEDGSRAADGVYTLSLSATRGDDKVEGRTLQFGAVTSIVRGTKGTDLQVGDLGLFKLDDIKQIL